MADCKSCKAKEQASETVPYIVHEGMMAMAERTIKRLWITIRTRRCKYGGNSGCVKCNICHGAGRIKKSKK